MYHKSGIGKLNTRERQVGQKDQLESTTVTTQPKCIESFLATSTLPPSSKRAKDLTDSIGYFIAKDMQPVSVVQDHGFQHLMKTLEPRYQISHRKTFTDHVLPGMYTKVKELIIPVVCSAKHYAITTDYWTSRGNASYAGVMFHTITDDWEMKSFVLENKELSIEHTAENLSDSTCTLQQ